LIPPLVKNKNNDPHSRQRPDGIDFFGKIEPVGFSSFILAGS